MNLKENRTLVYGYKRRCGRLRIWIILAIIARNAPANFIWRLSGRSSIIVGLIMAVLASIATYLAIFMLWKHYLAIRRKQEVIWAIRFLPSLDVALTLIAITKAAQLKKSEVASAQSVCINIINQLLIEGVFANLQWNADRTELIEITPSEERSKIAPNSNLAPAKVAGQELYLPNVLTAHRQQQGEENARE